MQLARGPRRWLLDREVRRVRCFEASQYGRFGCVTVVSEQDREALAKLDPRLNVAVIPLGVDSDAYAPAAELPAEDKARIVFTGVMRYPPNVSGAEFLARNVMPRVRAAWPGARLCIVGRDPAERVRALALADEVDVVGEVPDLGPWLATSRVYACPMVSGTGIKNKLLEAMSCGLPCVVTPLALQGSPRRAVARAPRRRR
jgi:glycosyltransferase involved in cell wall biosynthesis